METDGKSDWKPGGTFPTGCPSDFPAGVGDFSVGFDYPEEPEPDAAPPASREEALDALRGVVHLLLASRSQQAAWRRLHVLAWELRMLPEIHSQRELARKLGVSDGQITNLKSELAAMATNRGLEVHTSTRN